MKTVKNRPKILEYFPENCQLHKFEMNNKCLFVKQFNLGWLATGPRGVIVDTMTEAFKVGQTILNDLQTDSLVEKRGFAEIEPILAKKGVRPVSFQDWQTIDQKEKEKGQESGKPREKFTNVSDMMETLPK